MQGILGLGCLLFGAVSDKSCALGEVEMECQERAMLHADRPEGGTVDLENETNHQKA